MVTDIPSARAACRWPWQSGPRDAVEGGPSRFRVDAITKSCIVCDVGLAAALAWLSIATAPSDDMTNRSRPALSETAALGISILWLLVAQLASVLAWDAELVTRQAALVHWLLLGVLPPAMALWTSHAPAEG